MPLANVDAQFSIALRSLVNHLAPPSLRATANDRVQKFVARKRNSFPNNDNSRLSSAVSVRYASGRLARRVYVARFTNGVSQPRVSLSLRIGLYGKINNALILVHEENIAVSSLRGPGGERKKRPKDKTFLM